MVRVSKITDLVARFVALVFVCNVRRVERSDACPRCEQDGRGLRAKRALFSAQAGGRKHGLVWYYIESNRILRIYNHRVSSCLFDPLQQLVRYVYALHVKLETHYTDK